MAESLKKNEVELQSNGLYKYDDTDLLDEINKLKLELSMLQASGAGSGEDVSLAPSVVHSARTGTKEVLRMIIRARDDRLKFLPAELFADPAWDMLLDLYLGDILSQRISVSSLCTASKVPASTALRWIGALDREGLIERDGDHCDGRRYFISLSKTGLERMDGYFESLARYVTLRGH